MAQHAAASPVTATASPTAAQDPSQAAREAMATPGFRSDPTVAELASSTPHAYQKPDPRWDALQESMHETAAALPPGFTTPMHACGDVLVARLKAAKGVTVECA